MSREAAFGGAEPALEVISMKTAFLVLLLFVAAAAFGQGYISSQVSPYRPPDHPEHASIHALADERAVISGSTYTSAQGEKPMWEFQQAPQVPLGDVARILKEEHAKLKKARIKLEN